MKKSGVFLLIVLGVIVIALSVILIFPERNPFRGPPKFETLVTLIEPPDGAVVPLHGTFLVRGEAVSQFGVAQLVLYINGQPWGSESFEVNPSAASGTWLWTPSGEGAHELYLLAIDEAGQVTESAHAKVLASAAADVRFPVEVTSVAGDTLESLAAAFGASAEDIGETNPDVDVNGSLSPGTELTIPVPVPNSDPAYPESGAVPAPPSGPLPGNPDQALINVLPIGRPVNGTPDFVIVDGKLIPGKPIDRLYLYASLEGESPWRRIPENPQEFLLPGPGGFDFSDYVDFAALEASPTPMMLDLEAWGWQGGSLVALGSYHGMVGGGLTGWPPSATQLHIVEYESLGIKNYSNKYDLVGEAPSFELNFEWQASQPAFFVRRQVSTQPFPNEPTGSPPGLLLDELLWGGESGDFEIDFAQFFVQEETVSSSGNGWLDNLINQEAEIVEVQKIIPFEIPVSYYVRILEMSSADTGPLISNTVVVHYLPSGEVLANESPSGPIYQTEIVEYTPYRPPDENYTACTVVNEDIVVGGENNRWTIPAGTLGCGCPGVQCSSGEGSSCGWEPWKWGNCISDAAEWFVTAVKDLASFAANLYNDAKAFVVDTISSVVCGQLPEETQGACKLAIEVGVNAGLAAVGLPPEIPDFEKLFDEGLEYAIATAVSEVSGFDCDQTCRDLLKKAYQGASNPEQIYEQGLDYGLSLIQSELEDSLGCDSECVQIIEKGVQGVQDPESLSEEALVALANEAALKLKDGGYDCDPICEEKILDGLRQGYALGKAAATNAGQAPAPPLYGPHPLGQVQPAVIHLEVFRRYESSQLDPALIAERCSGFSITDSTTNENWNVSPLEGQLFDPKFVEMPLLQPGESITIPVVLEPSLWYLPQEVSLGELGLPAWLLGYEHKDLGSEGGERVGQVQIADYVDEWRVLYYGSSVEFSTFGPYVLDSVDGQLMSFPCFAGNPQVFDNLQP